MQCSFEFFPPRTAKGEAGLLETAHRLNEFQPRFVSVTCGAGGSSRSARPPWRDTAATLSKLVASGIEAAPHLTIGACTGAETERQLDSYLALGVKRVVALRGDSASVGSPTDQGQNAELLVRRIRRRCGDSLFIEVAGYPEVHPDAASPAADLMSLKRKVDAGADGIITQYFYNSAAFFRFRERAQAIGIQAPIVAGIMPLTNFAGIVRFSRACGADIPRWIHQHLEAYQHDQGALRAFGVEVVTRLCQDLLAAEAAGLHFYTLNRWQATTDICKNLGLACASRQAPSRGH